MLRIQNSEAWAVRGSRNLESLIRQILLISVHARTQQNGLVGTVLIPTESKQLHVYMIILSWLWSPIMCRDCSSCALLSQKLKQHVVRLNLLVQLPDDLERQDSSLPRNKTNMK